MWTLVFIYFYDAQPYIEQVSQHTNMMDCFAARQMLSEEHGKGMGHFKAEQQAICIIMNES